MLFARRFPRRRLRPILCWSSSYARTRCGLQSPCKSGVEHHILPFNPYRHMKTIFSILSIAVIGFGTAFAEETNLVKFSSKDGKIVYTVTGDGLRSVSVAGHELATGSWIAYDAAPMLTADWKADGPKHPQVAGGSAPYLYPNLLKAIQERQVRKTGENSAQVVQKSEGLTTTTDYLFEDGDVTITARLDNISGETLKIPTLGGLRLVFPDIPKGRMLTWHTTYLQHIHREAFHPAWNNRIGGAYAVGGRIGVGVSPGSVAAMSDPFTNPIIPTFIHWDHERWEQELRDKETIRWLSYAERREIPAGGALTMRLHIRFSADSGKEDDWKTLLEPYKKHFLRVTGGMQYKPDFRMVASTYINHSQAAYDPVSNPYALHGGFHRFDTAEGVDLFCNRFIPAIKTLDGQGMLIWGHSGDHPRGAMYRTDIDVIPPELERGLREIAKRFKEAGLHLGICTRPGELTVSGSWTHDNVLHMAPSEQSQIDDLINRFRKVRDMGMTTFYLDSFGVRPEDVEIMRILRKELGPDIQTYAEQPCDLILAFGGGYSETSFHGNGTSEGVTQDHWTLWVGEREVAIYRWLMGNVPIVTRHYDTHGTIPKDFEPFEQFVRRVNCVWLLPTHQFPSE